MIARAPRCIFYNCNKKFSAQGYGESVNHLWSICASKFDNASKKPDQTLPESWTAGLPWDRTRTQHRPTGHSEESLLSPVCKTSAWNYLDFQTNEKSESLTG